MANFTLDLISASSIEDDIAPLNGCKNLWRVTSEGVLVAYCADKSVADRIAHGNLYRVTIGTRQLFSYPSAENPVAMCVGTTNALLREDDQRKDA